MEVDADKLFENSIRDAIREGIKAKMSGYNSPLENLMKQAIETRHAEFRSLLDESIASCVNDDDFRNEIGSAVRKSLAKTLIQRFGGEMEKQFNALKSDPLTRARITMAIEEIVKQQQVAV
jgi:hypothetical protein